MSLVELQERAKEIRQRLRSPPNAVPDRPINLKFKNGIVPNSISKIPVEKPVDKSIIVPKPIPIDNWGISPANGNWPSLEPWGARAGPPVNARNSPANFHMVIKRTVCNYYGVSIRDLDGDCRVLSSVIPRHIAMYLTKVLTSRSYPEIGRRFGGKDHSSVLNAVKKIPKRMIADPEICQAVVELQSELEAKIIHWRAFG